MRQRLVLPPMAAAAFLVAILALATLDNRQGEAAIHRQGVFPAPLFNSAQVSALSGGYGPAIADIYWIRAVSADEDALRTEAGQWHLFKLLLGVTAADPRFEPPYEAGAMLLSVVADRPDLADLICARAELYFPQSWKYPFYRGFFRLYHDLNFESAVLHLERAATRPGVPGYLKALARRIRWQQPDARAVLELIARLEKVITDPEIRSRMQMRRNQIVSRLRAEAGP